MLAIIQEYYGEIFQSIGLIFDVVGVLLIVDFFKKKTYSESSPHGITTNHSEILTSLANETRLGSGLIVIGFIFQLVGVWL